MARVIVGVGGGIAAYKACLLVRLFTEAGHRMRVVPTEAALRFVGAPTWEALSGEPVSSTVFERVDEVEHVRLGHEADLVVVAPATADLLARAASGLADDLLTTTLLTATCPVLMAPAMHTEMWRNAATQANVATLRGRGVHVLDPASGRLTGADSGPGRLPEPADIHAAALNLLRPRDLAGLKVVVSAGGTREPLDPVRFLGNRSSGRQGHALVRTAVARGADVVLVNAATDVAPPVGVPTVTVETALELRDAMLTASVDADVVVMAAAVADYRPASMCASKMKKDADAGLIVQLVQNPDVLAELSGPARRPGQTVVGFAAETGDETASVIEHGRAKLARKRCDLLVVNEVGEHLGFGTPDNAAVILDRDGTETPVPRADKQVVADAIWDAVLAHRHDGLPAGRTTRPA